MSCKNSAFWYRKRPTNISVISARVAHVLEDEELAIDVRKDMISYIEVMDKKFTQSMNKWRERLTDLESEKNNLNKKIYSL